jgi:hypothetical protein
MHTRFCDLKTHSKLSTRSVGTFQGIYFTSLKRVINKVIILHLPSMKRDTILLRFLEKRKKEKPLVYFEFFVLNLSILNSVKDEI